MSGIAPMALQAVCDECSCDFAHGGDERIGVTTDARVRARHVVISDEEAVQRLHTGSRVRQLGGKQRFEKALR